MEDLKEILDIYTSFRRNLDDYTETSIRKLNAVLFGPSVSPADCTGTNEAVLCASPKQTKKRVKRLTSLQEYEEAESLARQSSNETAPGVFLEISSQQTGHVNALQSSVMPTLPQPPSALSFSVAATSADLSASLRSLMPPPPPPAAIVDVTATFEETSGRPQRAAKIKCEKNLKEPKINTKMRRPSDKVNIKIENDQRSSQTLESQTSSKGSLSSNRSDSSIIVLPDKVQAVVNLDSEDEEVAQPKGNENSLHILGNSQDKSKSVSAPNGVCELRELRIIIKREKQSDEHSPKAASESATIEPKELQMPTPTLINHITQESNVTTEPNSDTTDARPSKKGRKKKNEPHKPIKVERFSDLDKKQATPIAARTRQANLGQSQKENHSASIYEDAVDNMPANVNAVSDATMVLGVAPNDATFSANPAGTTFRVTPHQRTFVVEKQNPNATVTLTNKAVAGPEVNNTTFNVPAWEDARSSLSSSKQSMETAKGDASGIGESSTLPVIKLKPSKIPPAAQLQQPSSAKIYKLPAHTKQLFNPVEQSPVKMKVKAFEQMANTATDDLMKSGRPKRVKDTALQTTETGKITPVIGKLRTAPLGRFLTPTQSSNTLLPASQVKKATNSACKTNTAASLRSYMNKPESSIESYRQELKQMAEERKKQREQKHAFAAQQREAKERERAERMAKAAREREEKRLKKQAEAEQRKRELEEIQRKLRQQEEEASTSESAKQTAAKLKAIQDQKQGLACKKIMQPPLPKGQSKYTFEMLHEDDSTDDERKTSNKRPPAPHWSRGQERGPAIEKQHHWPTAVIDSFFSVQPLTPDLKKIFPDIDKRQLQRNSSVFWNTPPRYSELPKY